MVVATLLSSAVANAKSPMPDTRQATGGSADGLDGRVTRTSSVAPG
jgi:hypothetical protein